ncbi:hypothetical protein ASZ90_017257 [hydrocarbon metagenome]|uniref:Uncharacterized protein n=1 Tax=hydrocarbon metagenome TaxID=938273 RepID=A0A0W8E9K0_9ZZZZ
MDQNIFSRIRREDLKLVRKTNARGAAVKSSPGYSFTNQQKQI